MQPFPPALLASLKKVGLSNFEAEIYSALVLFGAVEVKELVEYLDISKPSIYEGLDSLEKMGLAIKQNSRPVMYRPMDPDAGIMNLLEQQTECANTAIRELKKIENQKAGSSMTDAVWTIFGVSNIEAKIRGMLRSSKSSIECRIGERYLHLFKGIPLEKISIDMTVLSNNPDIDRELEKIFPSRSLETFRVISLDALIKMITTEYYQCSDKSQKLPHHSFENEFAQVLKDELILLIDDKELLFTLSMTGSQETALNTFNAGMIRQSKIDMWGLHWEQPITRSVHTTE